MLRIEEHERASLLATRVRHELVAPVRYRERANEPRYSIVDLGVVLRAARNIERAPGGST